MPQLTYGAALQLQKAVPASRFQTYLDQSSGVVQAAKLYLWDIEAASAVTEITGIVEVMLRETIDRQLRLWNLQNAGTHEWIVHPKSGSALARVVRRNPGPHVNLARSGGLSRNWWEYHALSNYAPPRPGSVRLLPPPPTHDDLVAILSFGSWTSLLPVPDAGPSNHRLQIWNQSLNRGFSAVRREAVYRYAHELRWMRNRAAHLRPMLDVAGLHTVHRFAIRLLRAMDADFAQIIAGQATIPTILRQKP